MTGRSGIWGLISLVVVVVDVVPRLVEQREEVLAVVGAAQALGPRDEVLVAEEPGAPRDLLGAADLQALPQLDGAHELSGGHQRLRRARVEPCGSTRQLLDVQPALLEV